MHTDSTAFKHIVEKIQGLPTIPNVAIQLLTLARDPNAAAKDVEKTLATDPSLTMKVMRVANSSFYGYSDIKTLHEAVIVLGFPAIRSIVMSASVFEAFPGTGRPGFNRVEFWKHSLAVAVAARLLALKKQVTDIEEAFTAGLIHDIGKIVLDEYASDLWEKVVLYTADKNVLIFDAEMAVLGFSHAQVGQWLATKWKLSTQYTSSIFHHHQPAFARPEESLASFVHLADHLARTLKLGSGGDSLVPPIDSEAWKRTSMDDATFEKVASILPETFEKASSSFVIPGSK